jgi:uncharacterized protein (DUF1501 family)
MHCNRFDNTLSRRDFLMRTGYGAGAAALHQLFGASAAMAGNTPAFPNFAPKAKRVICLFQSGGPSHLELFDPKPLLKKRFNEDLPDSVRQGQRITGMVSGQARLALQPSKYSFRQCGQNGTWISDLLPHTQGIVDEITIVRSMTTEAINHDPAITFFQTGNQQPGRPSMGSWLDYGLGTMNSDLPAFIVFTSIASDGKPGQGLLSRLWGNGFLPGKHQGVQLRTDGDPVLYLSDPKGVTRAQRRSMLDRVAALNRERFATQGDPEIETRISQYELAYRMQASVPEMMDMGKESPATLAMYGDDVTKPGTYARNCLLARRLAERGVRFIQLYHRDWDHHGALDERLPKITRDVDQPSAALVKDLKQRGMLDDTLVIWGGEFGRTPYAQGGANLDKYGRDHHGRCFSLWMAGGGIKPGLVYGSTDEFGFNITENPVTIHDLHATILHCLGIDHTRLTHRFQGLDFRLTGVEASKVVKELLV